MYWGKHQTGRLAVSQLLGQYGKRIYYPTWADKYVDLTDRIPVDTDLYMGYVGLGTSILLAVFDSGGARSMCDMETAQMLGIKWLPAK